MKYVLCLLFTFLYADVSLTLARIEELILNKEKGIYFCFEDQDLNLFLGKSQNLWDQFEMEEVFALEAPHILKSYDLSYSTLKQFQPPQTPYSPLGPSFLSTLYREKCRRFFQFLQSQNILLVSDVAIPPSTQTLLFGPSCKLVSPTEIEDEDFTPYKVLILATCPNEKFFVKRLLERKEPFFLIDLSDLKTAFSTWKMDDWARWLKKKEPGIKILCTSALIPFKFEERKEEYIKSLKIIESYGFKSQTYIAESGPYTPLSFFEDYCDHVYYSNSNDTSYINKGVNEAKAMIGAFNYFDFDDDDMIVKLTGRYYFNSDDFLQIVKANPEMDAIASYYYGDPKRGINTGCYAIRCKYFKQMLNGLDFKKMEEKLIDIELEAGRFLEKMEKVKYLEKTGITANVNHTIVEQR